MDLKMRVKEVLQNAHLMSLGVYDGTPWVADLIFIYDDDLKNLYWMSDPDCRHSQAILENEKVAGSITVSNKSKETNLGIQFEGIAHKIDGPRHDLALKHFAKRGKLAPQETDDVLNGDFWYELELSKIRLIDEEHFGYETQDVETIV